MDHDLNSTSISDDEELVFPLEEQDDDFSPRLHSQGSDIFHSIDGVDIERPANPLVAILEYQEAVDSRKKESKKEPMKVKKLAVTPVPRSRKRKTLKLPNAPAQIIRPVAKRPKSNAYERGITAPALLMGSLCLDRTRDRYYQQIGEGFHSVEIKKDKTRTKTKTKAPFRSASINIPNSFQPILWPGDAMLSSSTERDCSHSCSSSSSSSSKSWTSDIELVCRRSLDVSSPVRECFNDLELHSSAGSYTGS